MFTTPFPCRSLTAPNVGGLHGGHSLHGGHGLHGHGGGYGPGGYGSAVVDQFDRKGWRQGRVSSWLVVRMSTK